MVISHVFNVVVAEQLQENALTVFFTTYFDLGRFGVVLFFLTSGFVIPWSLNKSSSMPLKRFAITRFFRLYPLYWLSLIAALFFGAYGRELQSTSQYLANFTMLQKFMGFESVIALYWTLQIELVFYLVCAALFALQVLNHRYTCLLMCLGSLGLALVIGWLKMFKGISLPVSFPLALFSMFLGAEIRKWTLEKEVNAFQNLKIIAIVLAFLFPIIMYFNYADGWVLFTTAYLGAHVVFLGMISICKIEHKIFSYLGVISYSVYLVHSFVIDNYFAYGGAALFSLIGLLGSMAIIMFVTIVLSHITYKLVELPCIQLGKKVFSFQANKKLASGYT